MDKFLCGGLLFLLLFGLVACGSGSPEPTATGADPQATSDEQTGAETGSAAPAAATATASPEPAPRLTLALPTPKPVTTVQRPPTATPSPAPTATPTVTPTPTPLPDASVKELATNLRSGPSVGYPVLAEVPGGTPLTVLAKSLDGEWLKVTTPDGQEGWMFYLPLNIYIALDSVPVGN